MIEITTSISTSVKARRKRGSDLILVTTQLRLIFVKLPAGDSEEIPIGASVLLAR
jgi:hypothetical protein